MKILVTGGSGFIGGATVAALLNRGHDVINVDLQPAVHGERHYSVDVTDAAAVDEVFAAERPQRVIHLAAHISVPVSVEQPRMDMVQNIGGSLNVLESSRKFGVERVLFASSAAVYGNGAVPPIDEQTETVPVSPYGISKRAVEMYLTGFYCQWFSYAILRYANVYGPRQTPEGGAVIARFVEGAARHHAVQVFGDGLQTRDFVHVEDVARVNALAIEHSNSVLLNVGSGVPVTVNDLVSTLQSFMSRPLEVKHLPPRPGDIRDSYYRATQVRDVLGWTPTITLTDGLRQLYEMAVAER